MSRWCGGTRNLAASLPTRSPRSRASSILQPPSRPFTANHDPELGEITMKLTIATLSLLIFSPVFAADPPAITAAYTPSKSEHRYLIERTFPAGALDGLDAAGKVKINQTNAKYGVHWVMSYANAEKTKTYCVYEAPSEAAVRDAAQANKIPVDKVTEGPATRTPHYPA